MKWLKNAARPRSILVAVAAFALCQTLFLFLYHAMRTHGVPTSLDMMAGFSYPEARAHLALYSEPVKTLYNYFQLVDLAFPFVYGLLFATLVSWLLGKDFPGNDRVLLVSAVPLVGAAFDLCENTGIFAMIRIYPDPFETWAMLTSAAGIVKVACFDASLLAIATLTIILIAKRVRSRKQPVDST